MHNTADVNGTTLWYELVGAGDTVTPQLSEHYEVLNYDHRGYGMSARPQQKYTIEVWCDDLVALLDFLGKERVHVHGGSMGSFVAIAFALAHPDRVDKLLLGAGAVAKCDDMGIAQFRVWQHRRTGVRGRLIRGRRRAGEQGILEGVHRPSRTRRPG